MRRLLPLALAGVLLATVVVGLVALTRGEGPAPMRPVASEQPVGTRALRVLHAWDARRARAWSHASLRQLSRLYADRSPLGEADRAMLAAYRDRGLRVAGMRRQTFEVRVLLEEPRRLRLRVTDRLVGSVAVGDGVRQRLPRGGLATRTLTFRRTAAGWVLVG